MKKVFRLAASLLAIGLLAGANARAADAPKSLGEVGELGENIYDLTKANKWAEANGKYEELKKAAQELSRELKDGKAGLDRLADAVKGLGKSVPAKERLATLKQANQVTLIAADLNDPFKPKIPAAVTRLDFYGRELEIGVEAKDNGQLKAAVIGLRKNWDSVKDAAKAKGGDAEVKRFDALVTQVEAAKSVADYSKAAKPILDEVDNLEKVFSK